MSVLWWALLTVLALMVRASRENTRTVLTVCDDESCRCDSFARVICNCTHVYDEVIFRPNGSYSMLSTATAIIVDGCARVYFMTDTIRSLFNMRTIEIRNVQHVYFSENSMSWSPYPREYEHSNPGLRISITNSTINEIALQTFKGRVDDILISSSRINVIRSFAFSSLIEVKNIELRNNIFDTIEIQAFKKFTTVNFILRGGRINNIPSRLLSDVEVVNVFHMEGVTVSSISSMAFLVTGPKRVLIDGNNIGVLEGDAFHIDSRGPATFRNNTVSDLRKGAFFGMTVDREMVHARGLQELLIDNNTIVESTPAAFLYNRTSFSLRIDGLNINQTCSCAQAEEWQNIIATQGSTISCYYPLEGHFMSLPTYVDSRCGQFKQNFWIFILVALIIAIIVALIIVGVVVRRERLKKKKLQIVMPDGKTYRETELHIIVERAELLTTDL